MDIISQTSEVAEFDFVVDLNLILKLWHLEGRKNEKIVSF